MSSLFEKFKFQKRSPSASLKKDTTAKDLDDTDGLPCTPPTETGVSVVPETPSSELPSPVFGKTSAQKFKKRSGKGNNSSENEEEKKPLSSVTKKVKIKSVTKKSSKSSKSAFNMVSSESDSSVEDVDKTPSRPCSSTSGYCSNNEITTNPSHEAELQRLVDIFIDRDREELQEALKSTSTIDEAIEKILNSKPRKYRSKRDRSPSPQLSLDTEYSSGSIKPAKKRARKQPVELQDSFTDSDATLINTQNKDQLLEELQQRFPKQDYNDLERILENSDWCVERATNTLKSFEDSDSDDLEEVTLENKKEVKPAKEHIPKQSKNQNIKKSSPVKKKSKPETNDKDSYRRRNIVVISSDEEEEGGSDGSYDNKTDDVVEIEDESNQGSIDENADSGKKGTTQDEDEEEEEDGCDGNDDEDMYSSDDSYEEEMSTEIRTLILSFFNDATVEELQTVPGCSKKKAIRIQEMRPFSDWQDLYDRFDVTRLLSTDIIWDSKTILEEREMLRKLMNKCNKISTVLQNIIAKSLNNDEKAGEDNEGHLVQQPKLLNSNFSLKPYQMIGLNWLVLLHRKEVNGILADEMGLGKTIQAIAFLAHLLESGNSGPFLIVVPSSTMDNWIREMHTWCPALEVLQYFGSQDDRRDLRAGILSGYTHFNVIVSTYNMCMSTPEDRGLFKKLHLEYIILDEAHMLKNMNSQRYRNLMKIKAERRLLLTGTPLQNNLLELMSLLCFLMPQIFLVDGNTSHLKRIFTSVTNRDDEKSNFERDQIANAKRIMQPFVLRRIKLDVLQQLPKKHDRVEKCPLSDSQQEQYNNLIIQLSSSLRGSSDSGKLAGAMMQLRKMANHALLHRHQYNDDKLKKMSKLMLKEPSHCDANPHLIFEDMSVMSDFELHNLCNMYSHLKRHLLPKSVLLNSGKFHMLDSLLPDMKKRGDRVLLFSQFTMMLDIIEVYMQNNKYKYLRLDGRTPVSERLELIDKYNNDDEIFVFLLSTKAGGLGINLTAANQVILHDIDFNPYNDKQAEDRCHRVGQTRDVTVVKLVSKNTIEEAILRCAMGKLRLEQDMTTNNTDDDGGSTDMAKLLREALDL